MVNSLMPCWKRHCDIRALETRRVTDGIKTSCCGIVLSIKLHDFFQPRFLSSASFILVSN